MRRISLVALAFALFACAKSEPANEHADHAYGDTAATTSSAAAPAATTMAPAGPMTDLGNGAHGYVAEPKTPGKHPGIVVVHEWWGLDDWVKQQTDNLASQGYVAVAVDLYRGKATHDQETAHELMRGMPEDRAVSDLKAGFNYLAARQDVDPKLIGSIGWCMGGGYSLALATNEPRLAACVINYGRLVTDQDTIAKINARILGNFGANDQGIPPDSVKAFGAALTKMGKLGDIKIYDGAGHAFMNPNNKQGYNAQAAADAQARIDRFFAATLRDKIPNS